MRELVELTRKAYQDDFLEDIYESDKGDLRHTGWKETEAEMQRPTKNIPDFKGVQSRIRKNEVNSKDCSLLKEGDRNKFMLNEKKKIKTEQFK